MTPESGVCREEVVTPCLTSLPPQLPLSPGRGTLSQAYTHPDCERVEGGAHSLEQRNQTSRSARTACPASGQAPVAPSQPRFTKPPTRGGGQG